MNESMKILVAVDGSDGSLALMDQVAGIPWSEKSEILILAVAEMPAPIMAGPMPMPGTYYLEWETALESQAEASLITALERFTAGGGRREMVTTRAVKGSTKLAIIDEAKRWGADLIMIGTHGYNAMERVWLGSVSRTVATHAECSVEIVRVATGIGGGPKKLLIAVDGSRYGDAAVAEVAARPWPDGTEVRIVTAIHLPFIPTPETWVLPDEYYAETEKSSRLQAEEVLRRSEEAIRAGNVGRRVPLTVNSEAILGHAEEVILAAAREWQADLILLGSHGHRAWERFLLGSVSQAVAWHAHCSVEIVRPKPEVV
jgi:nucleotide-binding universal stress UspA family protein